MEEGKAHFEGRENSLRRNGRHTLKEGKTHFEGMEGKGRHTIQREIRGSRKGMEHTL